MYLQQGHKVIGVNACPILRQCAGRSARHAVVEATQQAIREPAQNVPKEVMEGFEAKKAGLEALKLARTIVPNQIYISQTWTNRAIRHPHKTRKYPPSCTDQA